ncbi:hypothetical protein HDU82_004595 [Entophlyctis luteolus]|nr:hypothetical protein HDU82_004595 [Entophlyctis luteolus]
MSTLRMSSGPTANPATSDSGTSKNRAQSLGALEFQRQQAVLHRENESSAGSCSTLFSDPQMDPDAIHPEAFSKSQPRAKAVAFGEIRDEDWDEEIGLSATNSVPNSNPINSTFSASVDQQSRNAPLPPFPRKPKAPMVSRAGNTAQRRIVSAPSVAQTNVAGNSVFGNGADIVDAMWDVDDDEYLVASVKQKVINRKEKELERCASANAGLESWDDDFCVSEEETQNREALKVPEFLGSVQNNVWNENLLPKKADAEETDLKLIYLDAVDIAFGLEFNSIDRVAPLSCKYQKIMDTAKVLVHLGDFDESKEELMVADDLHLNVLGDVLGDVDGSAAWIRSLALSKLKLQFSAEYVPVLIKCVGKVKHQLNEYLGELRAIARGV